MTGGGPYPSTLGAVSAGTPGRAIHSTIGPDGERLLWVDGRLVEVHTTPEMRAAWPGLPERVYVIEPDAADADGGA